MLKKLMDKAQYRIFLALFLIVLIAFTSCYIILNNSTNAVNKQTKQNARQTAKSMVKSFDESFKEVNNTIYAVNLMHYQVYEDGGYKGLNMNSIVQLYNDARQMISQEYIFDFVIHFSGSSLAVTSQGTTDFDEFFDKRLKNIVYTPEFWKKFASTKHAMKIIPSACYTETTSDKKLYRRNLIGVVGNNKMINTKLSILVFLDEKSLMERVNQQNMVDGSSLIVLDQDGNIILNTDVDFNKDVLDSIHFGKEFEKAVNDGQFEYYCIKSKYNDFVYISKIPNNAKKMLPEMNTNRIVIIISFLFAAAACVLLSLYLYAPVKRMFSLLAAGQDGKNPECFDDALNGIKLVLKDNQVYKGQIELIEDDVRRSVFFRMIGDDVCGRKLKEQMETHFKAVLNCRNYAMLGFKLESTVGNSRKASKWTGVPSSDFADKIRKSLEGMFISPVVFQMENSTYVALVGINDGVDRSKANGMLKAAADELRQAEGAECSITAAISRFYEESNDCKKAYMEIKACMAYRSLRPWNMVVDYEKLNYAGGIYFPMDLTDKLSNLVMSGNAKESKAIAEHIITENMENDISCIKFADVVNGIFNTIINTLEQENYKKDELEKLELEFYDKVVSTENYTAAQSYIDVLIDRVAENAGGKKQSKLNREFILEYINLHYAEDLYLESMAQMTDTSSKYFSNFFKKAVGTNFIEYLNKVRIHHAKELLKNTDILVSDIGEKVGYSNSSTFTSTFKKYCGISPVEYRKDFR